MLEDHVVSIDIAQQLKRLGVSQRSLFHWERLKNGEYHLQADEFVGAFAEEWFAAYTVSELGDLLPEWFSSNKDWTGLWEAYPSAVFANIPPVHDEPSEADARGRLLIELLEQHPEHLEMYAAV